MWIIKCLVFDAVYMKLAKLKAATTCRTLALQRIDFNCSCTLEFPSFFFPLCLLVSQSLGFALEVCPARVCNLALCIQILDPYRRCCSWLSWCPALLWVQVRRENGNFWAEACPHLNPMKSFNFNALPIVMVSKDVSKICLTRGTILKTLIKQFKDFLVVLLGTHSPSHHCPCNLFLLLP